ncbi:MAG TPA: ATP-binding protein, partial [Clostridia bacterium]|nr:ATP-binding protein [Clostridia bacterium]
MCIDDFDFEFQPSINKQEILDLKSLRFVENNENIMSQLKKALAENRLEIRLKHFSKYKVLIIDEVGYLPIDTDASNIFFQLISKRYEKHST